MNPTPVGQPLESNGSESRQLMISVALMAAMFIGLRFLFPAPTIDEQAKAEIVKRELEKAEAEKVAKETAAAKTEAAAVVKNGVENATSDSLPEQKHRIEVVVAKSDKNPHKALEGDLHTTFSSHGGQIVSAVVTGYAAVSEAKTEDGKPVDLKTAPRVDLAHAQLNGKHFLALSSNEGSEISLLADAPYELKSKSVDSVVFERVTPEGWRITRTYKFHEGSFAFDHQLQVKNESDRSRIAKFNIAMVGKQRPGEKDGGGFMAGAAADTLNATCRAGEENEIWSLDDVKSAYEDWQKDKSKNIAGLQGQIKYAGIARHYFLSALLLDDQRLQTKLCASIFFQDAKDSKADKDDEPRKGVLSFVDLKPLTLKPGEMQSFDTRVFMGPKQVDLLQNTQDGLDENVDFGMFGVLSKPILVLLMWIYSLIGNFGLAIIALTVVIKLLTLPLTYKSMVSMQEMKNHQPEIKALQKKYGHDRTLLGQKQMEFYKENGVNPMAGCFPMLIQMPIWFALYRTLWLSVELFQKEGFLWLYDLSQPDVSPLWGIPVLPLVVGALMAFQTSLQPPPEDQPQMKYVMWGMPIMFTFFMLSMPSGLSIYMITNSLWTLAQTYFIKKKLEVRAAEKSGTSEASVEQTEKKPAKKANKKS
ncbi:MAG: membrane protein insertase YidC [Deltaproteobacteria bacterium]|nr:membrane protein insertase YidC [Deltaproteobacteria bacterium]